MGQFCKAPIVQEIISAPLVARSIRVDKKRWAQFVKWCQDKGTSTCFEIRSYIDARLGGEAVVTSRQPLTIHQTVMYQTDRPRRKAVLPEHKETVTMQYFGSLQKCTHCGGKPRVLGHVWVSPMECHAMYLCSPHHKYYKKKRALRYSFKPLGA